MPPDNEKSRLDAAARAGWLYFIAGHTQDEIAKRLKVSRATAQRLVSLCLSERLITFRLEHPIAACMDLAQRLADASASTTCEVVPTDPASATAVAGIAEQLRALHRGLAARRQANDHGDRHGPGACGPRSSSCRRWIAPNHQLVSLVPGQHRAGWLRRPSSTSLSNARRPDEGPALSRCRCRSYASSEASATSC